MRNKEKEKQYYQKNKKKIIERIRLNYFKTKYNLTFEDWNNLFISQKQKCAICETDSPGSKGWATDHDHITGDVRGILCYNCNFLLGHAKDNTEILDRAKVYLKRNK